uniref:Nucleoporin nsp1 n=1 Tax=Lygus hesperus TaxID=30085 RepID=A0A0A9XAG5_LYGHE
MERVLSTEYVQTFLKKYVEDERELAENARKEDKTHRRNSCKRKYRDQGEVESGNKAEPAKNKTNSATSLPPLNNTKPSVVNEKQQMAMLRNMKRENIRLMLAKQAQE